MAVFVASDKQDSGRVIRVRGTNIQDAALAAARKMFPLRPSDRWKYRMSRRNFFVNRETGTPGMSGVFCAYRDVREGGSHKVGCLHVWEPPVGWR